MKNKAQLLGHTTIAWAAKRLKRRIVRGLLRKIVL